MPRTEAVLATNNRSSVIYVGLNAWVTSHAMRLKCSILISIRGGCRHFRTLSWSNKSLETYSDGCGTEAIKSAWKELLMQKVERGAMTTLVPKYRAHFTVTHLSALLTDP